MSVKAKLVGAKRPSEVEKAKVQISGDAASAEIETAKYTGEASLLEAAGLDPLIWRVHKVNTTKGSVWMYEGDNPVERPLWFIKAEFRRVVPEWQEQSVLSLAEKIPAIKLPPVRYKEPKGQKRILLIGLADIHIGKQSVSGDCDLGFVETMFLEMVDRCIARASSVRLSEIVLCNLGDFLHVDTSLRTSTKGTPQDCVASFHEIYSAGQRSMIAAIERCRQTAPVHFVTTQGNHDWSASQHLATCMKAVFRNTKFVTVDDSPRSRKYYHRDKFLVGMSHGNNESRADYSGIMISERPAEYAASTCRIHISGHFHHKRAVRKLETHEQNGHCSYTLPSPSGIDEYHDIHGYVGAKRCCQAFQVNTSIGIESIHEVTMQEIVG